MPVPITRGILSADLWLFVYYRFVGMGMRMVEIDNVSVMMVGRMAIEMIVVVVTVVMFVIVRGVG